MAHLMNTIEIADPRIASLLRNERDRQEHGLEMIASENFVSRAVMQAIGSVPQTNMQRVILEEGTMVEIMSSTKLKILPWKGPRIFFWCLM